MPTIPTRACTTRRNGRRQQAESEIAKVREALATGKSIGERLRIKGYLRYVDPGWPLARFHSPLMLSDAWATVRK